MRTLSGTAIFAAVNIARADQFNTIREQRGALLHHLFQLFTQFAFQRRKRFCV
ncbi:hypothetical protein KCP77_19905 [Salmonella enterica subsp. enterica]|nr:hypothetical protein KCP77_19905 [Salmonella enterica subsp. enterica]